MEGWLIACLIIIPLMFLGLNVSFVRAWGDKSDRGKAFFPRAVIILSLVFAELSIVALPLDVAARSPSIYGNVGCGYWNSGCASNLELSYMWLVIYIVMLILVVAVIPFAIMWYENYEENFDGKSDKPCFVQCWTALTWQFLFSFVGLIVLLIVYAFANTASIPIKTFTVLNSSFVSYDPSLSFQSVTCPYPSDGTCSHDSTDTHLEMQVTFVIYLVAAMTWLGSWFFYTMTGVGLVKLPIAMIRRWHRRPRLLDLAEVDVQKKRLLSRAAELETVGELLKSDIRSSRRLGASRSRRQDKKNFRKFKVAVYELEKDSEQLEECLKISRNLAPTWTNTLLPWFELAGGILAGILSLLWILHIFLYVVPRAIQAAQGNFNGAYGTLFLNEYLQYFDTSVPVFGVITVAILLVYLLLCLINGMLNLGMRIFIIGIHPMRYGKTMANSFLVNVSIILMASPAMIQFACQSFASYTRSTDAELIFATQISNMQMFSALTNMGIFTYALIAFVVLTIIHEILLFSCYKGQNGIDEARFAKALGRLKKRQAVSGSSKAQ